MNTDEATTVCEAVEFFKGIDTLLFFPDRHLEGVRDLPRTEGYTRQPVLMVPDYGGLLLPLMAPSNGGWLYLLRDSAQFVVLDNEETEIHANGP